MKTALVTGAAGFIGSSVCKSLLDLGYRVIGLDSMSDYYDVALKEARESPLLAYGRYRSVHDKVETPELLVDLFEQERPDVVVHLAAQAGVRYSIEKPRSYLESNIVGTFELLEAARKYPPKHMLLASTSSAYGANSVMPYQEAVKADHQMSFYAATKKATESMSHAYAHLHKTPITVFRFFTVYGPWGRPDMALFKFTKSILNGDPIDVFNYGEMSRDFTFIDDLVHAISLLIEKIPCESRGLVSEIDTLSPVAPFRVINIGNNKPVQLMEFINAIETIIGKKAKLNFMPMQKGDVPATWADARLLYDLTGYEPRTEIEDGIAQFVGWYRRYYKV